MKKVQAETVQGRLEDRIVDGNFKELAEKLDQAIPTKATLEITNNVLLNDMRVVGELFGAGAAKLQSVLQSAETMRQSMRDLGPQLERIEKQKKSTIMLMLATVNGRVCRIGNNLVNIILAGNSYRVFYL